MGCGISNTCTCTLCVWLCLYVAFLSTALRAHSLLYHGAVWLHDFHILYRCRILYCLPVNLTHSSVECWKCLCLWWRLCWVLVSVSQMAVRVSPCWRCLRTASPCHSPPSSQVSAGWGGSIATYKLFIVAVLLREGANGSTPHWECSAF